MSEATQGATGEAGEADVDHGVLPGLRGVQALHQDLGGRALDHPDLGCTGHGVQDPGTLTGTHERAPADQRGNVEQREAHARELAA